MKVESNLYYDVITNSEIIKNKKDISKAFSQIFLDTPFKEIENEFKNNTLFSNSFSSQMYLDLFLKQISLMISQNEQFPLNKFFEKNLMNKGK